MEATTPPWLLRRKIQRSDWNDIKELHDQCLPVKYDDDFYESIVSGKVQSYAFEDKRVKKIVAILTANTKLKSVAEDADGVLGFSFGQQLMVYIMTLCVSESYRRMELVANAMASSHCKVVYLHVLDSNEPAIRFYEKHNFKRLKKLHRYYLIDQQYRDAYLYGLFINGGKQFYFDFGIGGLIMDTLRLTGVLSCSTYFTRMLGSPQDNVEQKDED